MGDDFHSMKVLRLTRYTDLEQVVNRGKQRRLFKGFRTACPLWFNSHSLLLATLRRHTSATLPASTLVKLNHDVRSHFSTTETFFGPQRSRNPYHEDFFRYHRCSRVKLCCSTVSTASTIQFDCALPTFMTNKLGVANNDKKNINPKAGTDCRMEIM